MQVTAKSIHCLQVEIHRKIAESWVTLQLILQNKEINEARVELLRVRCTRSVRSLWLLSWVKWIQFPSPTTYNRKQMTDQRVIKEAYKIHEHTKFSLQYSGACHLTCVTVGWVLCGSRTAARRNRPWDWRMSGEQRN